MDNQVMVSVYCLTYNHEKYIRKTLEGFISQKTSFKYEVFVHDDASTDGTAEIIREYEKKYPDIIKGIYQTENQFSKKINILKTHLISLFSGKYIATCEGDDYWCNSEKLQKQFDILEKNENVIMVTHNTKKITESDEEISLMVKGLDDGIMNPEFLVDKKDKNPHLSSLMYRKEVIINERPDFFNLTTGDNRIRLFALNYGDIYYINEVMSAYRVFVPGSWTSRMKNDREGKTKHLENTIAFFKAYDNFTQKRFTDIISKVIEERTFNLYCAKKEYKKAYILSKKIEISFAYKCYLLLGCYFPVVVKLIDKIKERK